MRIKARLTFRNENAKDFVDIIARSLEPDNVPEISTKIDENEAMVIFEGEKVGTILSSVDDYLMNTTIVEKLSTLKDIKQVVEEGLFN